MRPHLDDRDPRLAVTAADGLAASSNPEDVEAAEATLERLAERHAPVGWLAHAAKSRRRLRRSRTSDFRRLLVPLMYDTHREVATEAIRSAGQARCRRLPVRAAARRAAAQPAAQASARARCSSATARGVIDTLAYFLRDPDEDIWVRRHIPATLARIPSQKTMDVLVDALGERDGFLRFKVVSAIGRLRRSHPDLTVPAERVQPLIVQETNRYFSYLSLRYNLVERLDKPPTKTLLCACADREAGRTVDRVYRLLGLLYPWKDISAARWSLEHGEARAKASAAEYLDNMLDCYVAEARDAGARGAAGRGKGPARQRAAQDAGARRRGQSCAAHSRRGSGGRRGSDATRRAARPLGARPTTSNTRSSIATQGLVRVRGRLVGAGREEYDGRAASGALARTAARGRNRRSPAQAAGIPIHLG